MNDRIDIATLPDTQPSIARDAREVVRRFYEQEFTTTHVTNYLMEHNAAYAGIPRQRVSDAVRYTVMRLRRDGTITAVYTRKGKTWYKNVRSER